MKSNLYSRTNLYVLIIASLIFSALAIINPGEFGNSKRALAAEVVDFPDSNLEAVIRERIEKPTGDIYDTDLEGLTSFSSWIVITDITGLEYCTNLTDLNLADNQISDISPISGLTSLTTLSLRNNLISDISPLSGMTNLSYLELVNNQISDISPLSGLTRLEYLFLDNNQITDLPPLSELTSLTDLWIEGNQISNISPLSWLTSLTVLWAPDNQISDLSPLSELTNLSFLELSSNQINDLSPLSGLTNVDSLNLRNNQISDISPLSGLTSLKSLSLNSNQISDLSPLLGLTNLDSLLIDHNQIIDISPLSGLTSLVTLWAFNNQIRDISPLSGLTDLRYLGLNVNQISDIEPLVINTGLSAGDKIDLTDNFFLNETSINVYIPELESRGVNVLYTMPIFPTVTSINPGTGNQGITMTVTINGTNFAVETIESVSFGSGINVNSFHEDGSTQITASITIDDAAATGTRDVSVTTPAGGTVTLRDGFTVKASGTMVTPIIDSVSPAQAAQGETLDVVITGTNLDGAEVVRFGSDIDVNNFNVDSPTQITANITINDNATTGTRDVLITTPGGTDTMAGGFTVSVTETTEVNEITYSLTVDVSGNGTVSPSTGVHTYNEGTVVDIMATPDSGWDFVNWTGDVADPNSASTTVTIDGDKTIAAKFAEIGDVRYDLTMDVVGNGITSPSMGIHTYNEGTVVNITATPDSGWKFDSWTGDVADPDSADTTVTIDSAKTVTANFTEEGKSGGCLASTNVGASASELVLGWGIIGLCWGGGYYLVSKNRKRKI